MPEHGHFLRGMPELSCKARLFFYSTVVVSSDECLVHFPFPDLQEATKYASCNVSRLQLLFPSS